MQPRVLLAEDDAELRSLIAASLTRHGFQVVQAQDGNDALDRLGAAFRDGSEPLLDLVITDYRMPSFDGIDLMEALRLAAVRTPVIMITAFGDPETHAQASSLGAWAVVDKPFALGELLDLARSATAGSG